MQIPEQNQKEYLKSSLLRKSSITTKGNGFAFQNESDKESISGRLNS
jgi:hypothetical protein